MKEGALVGASVAGTRNSELGLLLGLSLGSPVGAPVKRKDDSCAADAGGARKRRVPTRVNNLFIFSLKCAMMKAVHFRKKIWT